jgi:acyl carrier protein
MDKELFLKVLLSRHFGVNVERVTPESRFADLGLDTAAELELQSMLEREFKITFSPWETDNMHSVQDVLDAINIKTMEEQS